MYIPYPVARIRQVRSHLACVPAEPKYNISILIMCGSSPGSYLSQSWLGVCDIHTNVGCIDLCYSHPIEFGREYYIYLFIWNSWTACSQILYCDQYWALESSNATYTCNLLARSKSINPLDIIYIQRNDYSLNLFNDVLLPVSPRQTLI